MLMAAEQVCWVPINDIIGWQEGDAPSGKSSLESDDVRENDQATVLLTLREEGGYQLLSGGERLRELKALGQSCVDAVISPRWDLEEGISALLTKQLKGQLHYLDEAEAYGRLLDTGLITRQELAVRLGRPLSAVQKKLRLLSLGEQSRKELRAHGLGERHAQAFLRVPGDRSCARMIAHAGERGLSVKEAESFIEEMLDRMPLALPKGRKVVPVMRDHRLYVNAIRGIVEQMRDAGLEASMQVGAGTAVVEVRVIMQSVALPRKGEKAR